LFQYRFGGTLLDSLAGRLGIDNTSEGLYATLSKWVLGHEQRHKTYAALIAEDLGSQFQLPICILGTRRFNIFTEEYTQQLHKEIEEFFSSYLGDKYRYNLSASWHPIKGVSFGGDLFIGESPPQRDCYVAHSDIMMPYTPKLTIGNYTIVWSKHWLKNQLFTNNTPDTNLSTIPAISHIIEVLEAYMNEQPPYDDRENASRATQENISILVYGFLIDGIYNDTIAVVFPGIVNISLNYGFERIKHAINGCIEEMMNETFGEAVKMIDTIFSGLNQSIAEPFSLMITEQINMTLQGILNSSSGSIDELIDRFEGIVKENVTTLLRNFIDPYIERFVDILLDVVHAIHEFADMLIDWLFDQISLNTAGITLTIWVVRE